MPLFDRPPKTYGVQRGDNGDYSNGDFVRVTDAGEEYTGEKGQATTFPKFEDADRLASRLYRQSRHRVSHRVCTFHPDGSVT
jgi:hypothetical protein